MTYLGFAAEKNNSYAMFRLGIEYLESDPEEGEYWFKEAAERQQKLSNRHGYSQSVLLRKPHLRGRCLRAGRSDEAWRDRFKAQKRDTAKARSTGTALVIVS